jgi:hypothetical protein
MKPVAPDLSASRWIIDGGVLMNTPFRPALDAVATLPADRQVRRVMAYVVPNLGDVEPAPADDPGKMKTPVEVALDSLSRLPRVQSIGRELEEIEANNVRVQRLLPGVERTGATVREACNEWLRYSEQERRVKASTLAEYRSDTGTSSPRSETFRSKT